MSLNPVLLRMAQEKVWGSATEKRADPGGMGMPTPGGGPPAGPAGAQPAAGGGPTGPPGMSPAPMPGMDPNAAAMGMGGAPGGMPGMPQPGMQPGMGQPAQQKVKPEQWMQMLDYRIYNLQQQLTAIMNALNVTVPAGALVMPPGTPAAPPAEAAMPGGSADPSAQQGAGGGGGSSAIGAIEPIQGASPEMAQAGAGGAGGGAPAAGKMAAHETFTASLFAPEDEKSDSYVGEPYDRPDTQTQAAAMAAMLRSKTRAA